MTNDLSGAVRHDANVLHARSVRATPILCASALLSSARAILFSPMPSLFLPGLASCRHAAAIRQLELARLTGLRPESLSRFERLRRPAGTGSIQRLADTLKVPIRALTGGVVDLGEHAGGDEAARLADKPRVADREVISERTCTDCGQTKPISAFVHILWNQKSTGFPLPGGLFGCWP